MSSVFNQELANNTLLLLQDESIVFSTNEEFRNYIIQFINRLITEDFNHLLFILYRIDVHEDKVRTLLADNNGEHAAATITDLIIEREKQKMITRQQFKSQQNIYEDEECELW
ncbi:MAG TPA: hypothetical protein PLC61_02285 [Chitinophagales bacterium]|nr:hypothetical protein [Chitinophagales bacterium]MCB9074297.1 hypothetical protein [Chitinophagales bacterium]HMU98624.1 hypothetical protein [Chitinophagales bacterium]HMV02433.1 hypothetical protein [Chitinophagales bacterium]HMW93608.1 hypothetical protein [Chitinophagales bacterium]